MIELLKNKPVFVICVFCLVTKATYSALIGATNYAIIILIITIGYIYAYKPFEK